MDRRHFLKWTGIGSAAFAAGAVSLTQMSCRQAQPAEAKKERIPLNISMQEGVAFGENLQEKLDFMESLGVVGLEVGGKGLSGRVDEIKRALEGRNIRVSAICAGFDGFILSEDAAIKQKFDTTMREIVAAAGQLGSTGVIMVPAFNSQKPCMPHNQATRDYLCAQLKELGDYALSCGTTVILEPLNRRECFYMRLVGDAAAIARDSQSEGVKCMGDFWHMQEEASDYGAFLTAGTKYLQHVHIASRGKRVIPGEDGDVDNYVDGFRALQQMGYDKYVSMECGCAGDRKTSLTAAVELMRRQWEEA